MSKVERASENHPDMPDIWMNVWYNSTSMLLSKKRAIMGRSSKEYEKYMKEEPIQVSVTDLLNIISFLETKYLRRVWNGLSGDEAKYHWKVRDRSETHVDLEGDTLIKAVLNKINSKGNV